MAKKTRIGLGLFFNNTTNSGIVNYIYNIVAALHTLPDGDQPEIVLLHNETAETALIKNIGYKRISYVLVRYFPKGFLTSKLNSVLLKLTGKNYYLNYLIYKRIDCFYPYFPFINASLSGATNKIEWLVDFNNRAFPEHYLDGGESMKNYQEKLTQTNSKIVLSSYSLLNELKYYYPNYKNEVKVLQFACSLPPLHNSNADEVKKKHQVTGNYFMSPNQFWEHKNQSVVLEAINNIKKANPLLKFKVLFSGSVEVNRGKGFYAEKIKSLISTYGLEEYIQFLGVLDRTDQLQLMRGSTALIQPSLYEGWSTLVEEAKALNKFIILSDLPVHREQAPENAAFFDPLDAGELCKIMLRELTRPTALTPYDYKHSILSFGKNILETIC